MRTTSTSHSTSISATYNPMSRRKNQYATVENISTIPWPSSPSRSPSLPSPVLDDLNKHRTVVRIDRTRTSIDELCFIQVPFH